MDSALKVRVSGTRQDPDLLIHHTGAQDYIFFMFLLPTTSFLWIPPSVSPASPSDVPGGFSVNQREVPREGGDLRLTCAANKFLYTALSWQRVNDTADVQSHSPGRGRQQLTSGEFSNSLVLLLSNLTGGDSGAYRCSARHLLTGQETHLDTQVVVTSESFQLFHLWLEFKYRKKWLSFLKFTNSDGLSVSIFFYSDHLTYRTLPELYILSLVSQMFKFEFYILNFRIWVSLIQLDLMWIFIRPIQFDQLEQGFFFNIPYIAQHTFTN